MTTTQVRANTDWFHAARFGTCTHYLADSASNRTAIDLTVDDWNRRVDAVDVEALAQSIADTGSSYHLLTLGQNSGFFCAPNPTYDALVGQPSRLSQRDLMLDLARALGKRGVRAMAYLPSHGPALHPQALEALGFEPGRDFSITGIKPDSEIAGPRVDERLAAAQKNWDAIVSDWSKRWGNLASGWWIDGCYDDGYLADRHNRGGDAPNFASFAAALKAGNPDSIVAFNPGVKMPIVSWTPYEDYTAGEVNDLPCGHKHGELGRWVEGAQFHVLSFLGSYWGVGEPRFPDELACGYTCYIAAHDGVTTWDVPISRDGKIPAAHLAQLTKIGQAVDV